MPVSRDTSHLWTAQRRPEWRLTVVRPDEPVATLHVLDGLDDGVLAARAGAGDRDAFDVLVLRHQRAVYQVCFRFVRDHAEASDAMQDAFVKAWRALPRFKGDAAFATWLYRVTVNTCLSRLAARRPPAVPLAHAAIVADPRENQATGLLAARAGGGRSPGRGSACPTGSAPRSSFACSTICRTPRSPPCSAARWDR